MVVATVVRRIAVPPEVLLAFVMDIERYAEVDDKLGTVLWSRREGDRLEFACRPTLVGLRQPKVVQYMQLTPGRRIDIGLLPAPANRLARPLADFHALFDCVAVDGGTELTRQLRFDFTPLGRRLLERRFAARLQGEVETEIDRVQRRLESAAR